MIRALIARMEEKYNIDKGHIFMQGMSMGNIMTASLREIMDGFLPVRQAPVVHANHSIFMMKAEK